MALLVVSATLATLTAAVGPASAATPLSGCTSIGESGTYRLASDVQSGANGACIVVAADDVRIDGDGHALTGPGQSGTALLVRDARNVTVRDVSVEDWQGGLRAVRSQDVRVTDSEFVGNAEYGVRFDETSNATVARNAFRDGSGDAVELYRYSPQARVVDNVVTNAEDGIRVTASTGADVLRNEIRTVAGDGIVVETADRPTRASIRDNVVRDATRGIYVRSPAAGNRLVGNDLRNNDVGVVVDLAENNTVRGGVIADNRRGIEADTPADSPLAVIGTAVRDNAQWDLYADRDGSVDATDVTVTGGTTLSFQATGVGLVGTEDVPPAPEDYASVGSALNVTGTGGQSSLTVSIQYAQAAVGRAGVVESTLRAWRHDGDWSVLSGENDVDADANVVSATTDEFGLLAPLGQVEGADEDDAVDDFQFRVDDSTPVVEIVTGDRLTDVSVGISRGGDTVRTLDRSDFVRQGDRYVATTQVDRRGTHTATLDEAVTVGGTDVAADESDTLTAVEFAVRPRTATTPADANATVDVVALGPDGGVGAYAFSASVAPNVARLVDVRLAGSPEERAVSITDGGATATVDAAVADTAQSGTVRLASLILDPRRVGETPVTVAPSSAGTEAGNTYYVLGSRNGTLTVEAPSGGPTVLAQPATDPDEDGLYEDVNGDGAANVVDVQALYQHRTDGAVQGSTDAFDVNGDGAVDVIDVLALYLEVTR